MFYLDVVVDDVNIEVPFDGVHGDVEEPSVAPEYT